MAIQDACALIDNYIVQASRAGKLLISSNRRRTALVIARYYLDTVRRREDVYRDYELAIKDLDRAMSMESVVRPDPPWWADPCNPRRGNGIRSWRIPQYYNGVSGKGLSGWWNDSGFKEMNDWRYDRWNSESNNNEQNWGGGRSGNYDDTRMPDQPTDDGGDRISPMPDLHRKLPGHAQKAVEGIAFLHRVGLLLDIRPPSRSEFHCWKISRSPLIPNLEHFFVRPKIGGY